MFKNLYFYKFQIEIIVKLSIYKIFNLGESYCPHGVGTWFPTWFKGSWIWKIRIKCLKFWRIGLKLTMYTFESNSSFIYILLVAFFLLVKFCQNNSWNEKIIFLGGDCQEQKVREILGQIAKFLYVFFVSSKNNLKWLMIFHSYLAYNQIWLNLGIDDCQHIENLPQKYNCESKFEGFRICNSPLTFRKRSERSEWKNDWQNWKLQ